MSDPATPSPATGTLHPPPSPVEMREEFLDLLRRDLVGPFDVEDEEVDESRVSDRYLLGLLAPQNAEVAQEEDEEFVEGDSSRTSDDGKADGMPNRVGSMLPASVGMSFAVAPGVDRLVVEGSWGRYERIGSEELETDAGNSRRVWKRIPCGGRVVVPLDGATIESGPLDPADPAIVVRGMSRSQADGGRSVTLFFVNTIALPPQARSLQRDEGTRFQVRFAVRGAGDAEGTSVFRARPTATHGDGDDPHVQEERLLDMGYRLVREFAVGHATAVTWTVDQGDPTLATELVTSSMPRHEVEQMAPRTAADGDVPELAKAEFRMNALAEASDDELVAMLRPLTDGYESWIESEDRRRSDPAARLEGFENEAAQTIEGCRAALERMREGLELLRDDESARDAFRFANLAMWRQRTRSIHAQLVRRRGQEAPSYDEIDIDRNRTWRPFQLAFILLNLAATSRPAHPDRIHPTAAIADLLWFPTGGGKTEAYLGLAAYTIGLRRLQGSLGGLDANAGVAVLMRYTLRLLTLQQFQRASALVCAMETIRREALEGGDGRWGGDDEPFGIGLWVGGKATPNWTSGSRDAVSTARRSGGFGRLGSGASPAQLPNCPWCGWELRAEEYEVEATPSGRMRTFVHCRNPACEFCRRRSTEGLPVFTVDEEIYRRVPSILVGTVDKFAQMPWNGLLANLFGRVSGYCSRHGFQSPAFEEQCNTHPATSRTPRLPGARREACPHLRPPDLIIQDELHLISGPLGSMVGLYETVIDDLCSWDLEVERDDGRTETVRVRPKVVASTATVRNAGPQVRQLFSRQVAIFPPPGLDASDNFFAVRRPPGDAHPGRLYLGICAPGRNLKVALIRAFTTELAAAQVLYEKYGAAADPYMTLVGYFNSLRELGGMRRLVDDDVRNRVRQYVQRGFERRLLHSVEELTSRVASIKIPHLLDRLERTFDPNRDDGGPPPFDVLLATSMISVGVDIDRLGLMTVGGQPKGTAEYIQATSRVGRRHPGVVVTVYNWARPRDLSHFERFGHYHACFYRFVESLSVTPFAERAIDRGVAALLVGGTRMTSPEFTPNAGASNARAVPNVGESVTALVRRRAANLVGESAAAVVTAKMEGLRDRWRSDAGRIADLPFKGPNASLLDEPDGRDWDSFTCLNSMRDVEATSALVLLDDAMSDQGGPR